jgi:predicted house-cleaning noncanonical NTP pyrophosphatase (MazG superfamily)
VSKRDIMKEKEHNKLARDKIPEVLLKKGITSITKILDDHEYAVALSKKLQEEVMEYLTAEEPDHQLEELADIQEVILAILAQRGETFLDLENVRKTKLDQRGGFSGRLFLEKTIESPLGD